MWVFSVSVMRNEFFTAGTDLYPFCSPSHYSICLKHGGQHRQTGILLIKQFWGALHMSPVQRKLMILFMMFSVVSSNLSFDIWWHYVGQDW